MPKASILLATFDMPRHLDLVLAGLEIQSEKDFEIIICDDGSGEETKKTIFSYKSLLQINHVWQDHQGFRKCKILNKGIAQAHSKVLIFLDGDCVPHKDFVKDHLTLLVPGAFVAGRRSDIRKTKSQTITKKDVQNGLFGALSPKLITMALSGEIESPQRIFRFSHPLIRSVFKLDHVTDLKGCNFSAFKTDIVKINGFDENFEGYGREDTDLEIRLLNLGLRRVGAKHMALQFHFWHEQKRFTGQNDSLLENTKNSRRTRAIKGLDQSP